MVYSSASSAHTVHHIHDTIVGLIQPPEVDGTEVGRPDGVSDLLEADGVTLQETADKDLPSIPPESGVTGDATESKCPGYWSGSGRGVNGRSECR
jgi:hypothetical protein